jgi:PPK2 family polyphosphate:nucleotide phosphotransferase
VLLVLQGMDTSGKDGTIRKVTTGVNPLSFQITAFKQPNLLELDHDFLWRIHLAQPNFGQIGIFNRSHYEDVLVVKVRGLAPPAAIEQRYEQINAFEKTLAENGTSILKFMLHISSDKQRERLQARLDEPDKRWKFNPGDLENRPLWDEFMGAYEEALSRCSTEWAPWFVIPSDRKWARNAAIAAIVRKTLENMDPKYPAPEWNPADYRID